MHRALVALALIALITGCSRIVVPSTTFSATSGPRKVGVRMLSLVDTTRGVDSQRGVPGSTTRTLPTTVWYPADAPGKDTPVSKAGVPYPLVVFAHGLRGVPDDYAPLLQWWAGLGYVVAAPTFPRTNRDANPVEAGDLVNQPADVSFVITSLIASSANTSDPFAGAIDPKRVIAAGHSEGALTTVMLFAQCCADARLIGAIIMAGDDIGTQGKAFTAPPKPLLYIHGDQDKIVNYQLGQRSYRSAPEPKAFLTLIGAGHIDPYVRDATGPDGAAVRNGSGDFLGYLTQANSAGFHSALRVVGTQAGVTTLDDHLP